MGTRTHRRDIDGLRAIAVLAVLIYHADLSIFGTPILPGGFLGVDVFFVISGFLITQILVESISEGKKGFFSQFYLRRARRILPSLISTVLVVQVISLFFSAPSYKQDAALSGLASLGSFSNVFWLNFSSSYASPNTQLQPLLHTWTLGIEEQFYFVLPIVIYSVWRIRPRLLPHIIILITVISFLFCVSPLVENPSVNYYSIQSRAWELGCGSILAIYARRFPGSTTSPNKTSLRLPIAGLAFSVLIISLIFIPFSNSHPGFLTLVPVLATSLFIHFNRNIDSLADKVLRSLPFQYIGKWSFAIYLVHFPLFAFFRQRIEIENTLGFALVLVSIALGYFLSKFVEQPLRNVKKFPSKKLLTFLASGLALSIILSLANLVVAHQTPAGKFNYQTLLEERWDYSKYGIRACTESSDVALCSKDEKTILVVGDSMVPDAVRILGTSLIDYSFIANTQGGCIPSKKIPPEVRVLNNIKECTGLNKLRFDPGYYSGIEGVAIITSLRSPNRLIEYVNFLNNIGIRKVIIFGPYIQLDSKISDLLSAYEEDPAAVSKNAKQAPDLKKSDSEFSILADTFNLHYVSPVQLLCNEADCPLFLNGNPFTSDTVHWTNFFTSKLAVLAQKSLDDWIVN